MFLECIAQHKDGCGAVLKGGDFGGESVAVRNGSSAQNSATLSPTSEAVRRESGKQKNDGTNEGGEDWSIYVTLLSMYLGGLMLILQPNDSVQPRREASAGTDG